MGDSGETVAIWERQNGINHDVQVSTRSPGSAFSAPVDLSPSSTNPDVAISPQGEAVAVWRHFDIASGKYVTQAATRAPGGSFSAPIDISVSSTAAAPRDFHVAVGPGGAAALVWIQKDPDSVEDPNQFSVLASVRPAGGSFSAPMIVSPLPLVVGDDANNPGVAVDASGDVVVAWQYNDSALAHSLIQVSSRLAGASFAAPIPISDTSHDAGLPAVAMDATGEATVVWAESDGVDQLIRAASGAPGGSFTSPVDLSASGQDAFTPDIAIAPGGDATAVWTRSNGSNFIIQAATRPPGGVFSAPADLSAPGQDAFDPEVAMNASGAATVVWRRSDGLSAIAQAATREPGGAFSPPADLSAPGQDAVSPGVAMDSVGDATTVWYRSNGANSIVQAAGYDVDAPVLRSLSIPASGVVGEPVSFSADPFDVWPIASTAFSFGDGTMADGTAVTHTYTAPGSYQVTVAAKDSAGTPVTGGGAISIIAPNRFSLGKLKRNKRTGRATLFGRISAPGRLVLFGGGVRKVRRYFGHSGRVELQIKPKRKLLKRLKRHQRARSRIKVDFLPTGGYRARKHRLIVLIRKPAGDRVPTAQRRP
ncbi:MAG TPA: PKD domain-containing protein [Solirubrobacterales bacterium]